MIQHFDFTFADKVIANLPTWLMGVEGVYNQTRLIQNSFSLAEKDASFYSLATGLLSWGWQHRPFDKGYLELLLAADKHLHILPPPSRAFLFPVLKMLDVPPDAPPYPDVTYLFAPPGETDGDVILHNIQLLLAQHEQYALFWLGAGFDFLLSQGHFKQAHGLLQFFSQATALQPFLDRLQAQWAIYALAPDEATAYVAKVDANMFGLWRTYHLALLQEKAGHVHAATNAYAALWPRMPWHTNFTLKMHDLLHPPVPKNAQLPTNTNVAILLYTWNKATDLNNTLHSLAKSSIGDARVFVLDNGSSDDTQHVLKQAAQAWPAHYAPFETIQLPVNVGAPAARNWLLSLDTVRESDYVAFLDDDIILPNHWLMHMLTVATNQPNAGAIGCRVTGHTRPLHLQSADLHLLPPEICAGGQKDFEEQVHVFDNCGGQLDSGLFNYTRPCVSVTGCCHLLNQDALRKAGHFDVRFNPSQFDDLEHDLRAYLQGFPCVYHGGLSIEHVQYSSLKQADSPARQAHIFGNKLKLEHLFSKEDVRAIVGKNMAILRQDLRTKLDVLNQELLPEG